MASFAVPCPKVSLPVPAAFESRQKRHRIAAFPRSDSKLTTSSLIAQFQGCNRRQSDVFKVTAEKTSNSTSSSKSVEPKESQTQHKIPDVLSISSFLDQVSDLVKLVDSRDIVELELKQMGCEIHIRKKEALPQPPSTAPVYFQPPPQQYSPPPQMPPAPTSAGSASSTPSPAPTPSAPSKPKSSHPPFKSPMAGTFYCAPSPGAPPFVKVGDKVQKGQVLCIIEAMKLMNEIEADHGGTVVEVIAEEGKPVSIDTPLFIIEP